MSVIYILEHPYIHPLVDYTTKTEQNGMLPFTKLTVHYYYYSTK